VILLLAVVILFIILAYQDIRYRQIQWILLLAIVVLSASWGMTRLSLEALLTHAAFNLSFIAFNFVLIVGYVHIRFKASLRSVFEQYLGIGDVLFWISITPLFSFYLFVVFFLVSLILSLFGFVLLRAISIRSPLKTVPLAGFQAVFYGTVLTAYLCGYYFDFYDELSILQLTNLGTD
jgi:hypothetical protein